MKKIKLALLLIPFAGLVLSGCGNASGGDPLDPSGGGDPVDPSGGGEADTLVDIVKKVFESTNITLKIDSDIVDSLDPNNNSTNKQFRCIDGNKQYVKSSVETHGYTFVNEQYFELGDVSYMYMFSNGSWMKTELPPGINASLSSSMFGLTEMLQAVEEAVDEPTDGVYYLEDFTVEVSSADFIATIGQDLSGYTPVSEKFEMSLEFVRVTLDDNDELVSLETSSHAITLDIDETSKTVALTEMTTGTSTTKVHDIKDIGTTVVTLPDVQ